MKKIIHVLISMVLIFSIIWIPKEQPSALTGYKYQILEIIDNGNSKISSLVDKNIYEVTTVRMKKFVALRDELIGKYDAIVLSEGTYNPEVVYLTTSNNRIASHDTRNKMNDITNLRAKQIKEFAEEGYLVLMHENSVKNQRDYSLTANGALQKGKLRNQFETYGNDKNTFKFFSTANESKTLLGSHISTLGESRPAFQFNDNGQPLSYSNASTYAYKRGEKVSFDFKMLNVASLQGKEYVATLYIDSDFNDQYTVEEQVVTKKITAISDKIEYTLPMGYSGIRYWKLEIMDEGTGFKTYKKGNFRVQDVPVNINVLQVRKDTNESSKLSNTTNMNQSYLKRTNDYEITINHATMTEFNSDIVHGNLNGKYNMLLFGFADVYNSADIQNNAVTSLKNYIKTKQSVMFTHDTMIGDNNNWVNNFKEETGQNYLYTDLGRGAVKSSTRTKKVNDGLLTQYPFVDGDGAVTIANTHNQYYALNLEDPETIPWYNIIDNTDGENSPRDYDDSWNHYYTYSKGSVTYSGTGHTSSGFPDDEQKLFVNTMYRAFLGANKAPLITVHGPNVNDEIPTNQTVQVSYTLDDLDLKDTTLWTRVLFNGVEVVAPKEVTNHSVVTETIPHGFVNSGDLSITIEAWDKENAKEIVTIPVKIIKLESSLEVSRTFKDNSTRIPVGEKATIEYTVTPKKLLSTDVTKRLGDISEFKLTNLTWQETFPSDVSIAVHASFETNQSDRVVKGIIPEILYRKNGSYFEAQPISFSVDVTPSKKGNYTFNQSTLTYKDYTKSDYTLDFNRLSLESDYAITSIDLPDVIIVQKGNQRNLLPYLQINPNVEAASTIQFVKKDTSTAVGLQNTIVTGIEDGSSVIEAVVTDKFGRIFKDTTTVYVRVPILTMTVSDISLYVGEEKELPLVVTPIEAYSGVTVENTQPLIATFDKGKKVVKGLREGTTLLTFNGFKEDGKVISVQSRVTVLPSEVNVNPKNVELYVGESQDVTVSTKPSNLPYSYIPSTPNIVEVMNGSIIARNPGETKVVVKAEWGSGQDTVNVKVWSMIPKDTVYLQKGETVFVEDIVRHFVTYLGGFSPSITEKTVTNIQDDYFVGYNSTHNAVVGKKFGKTKITIGHLHQNGKIYPIQLNVVVTDKVSEINIMPWY